MKKLISKIALLSFVVLMCSCEKNEDLSAPMVDEDNQFTFVYNGNTYSSPYEELENGEITLLDEEANNLREYLLEYPELITINNYDGSVEYIENEETALQRLNEGTLFKENAFTRGNKAGYYVGSSKLEVYMNTNYGGTSRTYNNQVNIAEVWKFPMADFSIASFKFSSGFHYNGNTSIPTISLKKAYARFYTGYNYTGKQTWWCLDYDLQSQNIKSMPSGIRGKALSLKVQWETY